MSEHYDGLLRQSVSDEWVPISKQILVCLNLEARISQIINYLLNFPILTVVFRGETHSTRNTPRGCTELLMVPTRNHLLFWGHCVVECKFQ